MRMCRRNHCACAITNLPSARICHRKWLNSEKTEIVKISQSNSREKDHLHLLEHTIETVPQAVCLGYLSLAQPTYFGEERIPLECGCLHNTYHFHVISGWGPENALSSLTLAFHDGSHNNELSQAFAVLAALTKA